MAVKNCSRHRAEDEARHGWLHQLVFAAGGTDKLAMLKFAAMAVLVIAAVGAVTSYTERYLTTRLASG